MDKTPGGFSASDSENHVVYRCHCLVLRFCGLGGMEPQLVSEYDARTIRPDLGAPKPKAQLLNKHLTLS